MVVEKVLYLLVDWMESTGQEEHWGYMIASDLEGGRKITSEALQEDLDHIFFFEPAL